MVTRPVACCLKKKFG